MGLANVEQRFKSLLAEPGTIAHDVHAVLAEAASKINEMVEAQPVLFSIIQHLEMAAHLTVSSPTLQQSPASAAANPTTAGPTEVSSATAPGQPAPTTSTASATDSKGSSAT